MSLSNPHNGELCHCLLWLFAIFLSFMQLLICFMRYCRKVLISQSTFEYLQGEYDVEPANVTRQNKHLHDRQIGTFYVAPSRNRGVRGRRHTNNINVSDTASSVMTTYRGNAFASASQRLPASGRRAALDTRTSVVPQHESRHYVTRQRSAAAR